MLIDSKTQCPISRGGKSDSGFTLVEVIIAGMILVILCVGVLTVFEQVIKLNRGNSIRTQALSVLQKKVELYRAMKFEPVAPDPLLAGHDKVTTDTGVASADGTLFDVAVTIDNDPYTNGVQTATSAPAVQESACQFKEITVEATPHNAQAAWITAVKTKVTFQRVRLVN